MPCLRRERAGQNDCVGVGEKAQKLLRPRLALPAAEFDQPVLAKRQVAQNVHSQHSHGFRRPLRWSCHHVAFNDGTHGTELGQPAQRGQSLLVHTAARRDDFE